MSKMKTNQTHPDRPVGDADLEALAEHFTLRQLHAYLQGKAGDLAAGIEAHVQHCELCERWLEELHEAMVESDPEKTWQGIRERMAGGSRMPQPVEPLTLIQLLAAEIVQLLADQFEARQVQEKILPILDAALAMQKYQQLAAVRSAGVRRDDKSTGADPIRWVKAWLEDRAFDVEVSQPLEAQIHRTENKTFYRVEGKFKVTAEMLPEGQWQARVTLNRPFKKDDGAEEVISVTLRPAKIRPSGAFEIYDEVTVTDEHLLLALGEGFIDPARIDISIEPKPASDL